MADNAERLSAEYEVNKHRYTNLERQVRARHILIKAGSYATEEQRAEAKQRAEALQKRAAKGEDFAKLASKNSDDQVTAKKGGDIGFLRKDTMPDCSTRLSLRLEVDQISQSCRNPVRSSTSSRRVAIREGDVPDDEAKQELAEGLYQTDWAKKPERATRDAVLWLLGAQTKTTTPSCGSSPRRPRRACDPLYTHPRRNGRLRSLRQSGAGLRFPRSSMRVLSLAESEAFLRRPSSLAASGLSSVSSIGSAQMKRHSTTRFGHRRARCFRRSRSGRSSTSTFSSFAPRQPPTRPYASTNFKPRMAAAKSSRLPELPTESLTLGNSLRSDSFP